MKKNYRIGWAFNSITISTFTVRTTQE